MNITENYKLKKDVTENVLKQNGFRNKTFKCWVYKNIIQLIVKVNIEDSYWNYEIYDVDTDSIYAPYYDRQNKNLVVEEIDRKLDVLLSELVKNNILEEED